MARNGLAFPHLTLDRSSVTMEPVRGWTLVASGPHAAAIVGDGDAVQAWDATRPVRLRRRFLLPPDFNAQLGFEPARALFGLVVVVSTGRGLVKECVHGSEFRVPESQSIEVEFELDSTRLARDLAIKVSIVLKQSEERGHELSARVTGAPLWADELALRLEGGASRISMEAVSFRARFPNGGFLNAPFHVETAEVLGLDIEQAIRVYLNADVSDFVSAVERGDPSARAALWSGVVKRAARVVLCDEAFHSGEEPQSGTLEGLVFRWLTQAFPGFSVEAVRDLALRRSHVFDATIDSWTGLWNGAFSPKGAE